MNDKDKWSAHLEYLKVAITLATAMLTVAAAIYSDPSKIPTDNSKFALLVCAIFVFLTLVSSVTAVIHLSNYLIRPVDPAAPDVADDRRRGSKITVAAGASFFCLVATGLCILVFFSWRTFSHEPTPPLVAIEAVTEILKGQIDSRTESLSLDSFEARGNEYLLDYTIVPGGNKFHSSFDPKAGRVESIKRQP
jgi:hypothetical protein